MEKLNNKELNNVCGGYMPPASLANLAFDGVKFFENVWNRLEEFGQNVTCWWNCTYGGK